MKNGRLKATVCIARQGRPDSDRKAIRRRPSSDASRDAAPGLSTESVGADEQDVSQ